MKMNFFVTGLALWLLVSFPAAITSLTASLSDDVLGLIVFKADLQDPRQKLSSWNEDDETPCNWDGVKCNPRSNRVTELVLDGFSLSGRVNQGLLKLQYMRKLSLANNNLTGSIGLGLAKVENLRFVDLSGNSLSGAIPDGFFRQCGSLRAISLARNRFSGKIPANLGSCASLAAINLSSNRFSGSLPAEIWALRGVKSLDLSGNLLDGEIPKGIEAMINLRAIDLSRNRFIGQVPDGIGRCLLLRSVDLSGNLLSGYLPESMRRLRLCGYLNLSKNSLIGEVPGWIGEMKSLEILDISFNKFSGQVLGWIFKSGLQKAFLFGNIQVLDLSHNAFSGEIPSGFGDLSSLQRLKLSWNSLVGQVPSFIGKLKNLDVLDLSHNMLNGSIPTSIENCTLLTTLILSQNSLTGPIPAALAKLTSLQDVDLSFNRLTGMLPRQLANLPRLSSFNISHNNLQGKLPSSGFFNTISPTAVFGNPSLCGSAANKSCPDLVPKPFVLDPGSLSDDSSSPAGLPTNVDQKRIILSISALFAIGAAAFVVVGVIAITVINLRVRSSKAISRSAPPLVLSGHDEFSDSYTSDASSGKLVMFSGEPDFGTGAHSLLNKDCELGRGGFGAVYRTVMEDGHPVAIKKLTVSSLVKSQEDFEREVKNLGKVRHNNLVALKGYYWTPTLQLLIYEFVSGGSLYRHIHEGSDGGNYLSWNERFNILLGTAKGLAHLHQSGIIHYDLKSSNVLTDGLGEPKLGDFGLANLLPMLDRYVLSSKVQSALGYMAPEFACKTVKITEKCDVYGFGVLVLEVVTGKKPVEYMEDDVVVLCDVVRGAVEEGRGEECIDVRMQGMFPDEEEEAIAVMKLGLMCTAQVPSKRPGMGEVVDTLELIRCSLEN